MKSICVLSADLSPKALAEHPILHKTPSSESIISFLNAPVVHKKSESLRDMAKLKSAVRNVTQNLLERVNLYQPIRSRICLVM